MSAWSTARQRGSATIWVLALATVVWATAVAITAVGQARAARHRAAAVADLAALAAARRMQTGLGACPPAAEVARVNGGRLVGCTRRGSLVEVVVEVPLRGLASVVIEDVARARARAGPAGSGRDQSRAIGFGSFPDTSGYAALHCGPIVGDRPIPVSAAPGATMKGKAFS